MDTKCLTSFKKIRLVWKQTLTSVAKKPVKIKLSVTRFIIIIIVWQKLKIGFQMNFCFHYHKPEVKKQLYQASLKKDLIFITYTH